LYIFDLLQERFFTIDVHIKDEDIKPFLHEWINSVYRDSAGNLLFRIRVDYEAYLHFIEDIIREEEMTGQRTPRGAATFMLGDSVFYRVNVSDIHF